MIRRENRRAVEDAFLHLERLSKDLSEAEPVAVDQQYPIENISRGGLRFHGSTLFHVDERINITVTLAGGEQHSALARICYRENGHQGYFHYGVSFLDNFLEMAACL
jgi:hypothetical protein